VTEPELRTAVIALADELGIRWLYFGSDVRHNQGQCKAFPTCCFAAAGQRFFAELKASGKRPRAAQRGWHEDLAAAGEDVVVWQPGDYLSGRVAEQLAGLNGTGPPFTPPQSAAERMWRALHAAASRQ